MTRALRAMLEICPQGQVAISGSSASKDRDSDDEGRPAVGSKSSWHSEEEAIEVKLGVFPFMFHS